MELAPKSTSVTLIFLAPYAMSTLFPEVSFIFKFASVKSAAWVVKFLRALVLLFRSIFTVFALVATSVSPLAFKFNVCAAVAAIFALPSLFTFTVLASCAIKVTSDFAEISMLCAFLAFSETLPVVFTETLFVASVSDTLTSPMVEMFKFSSPKLNLTPLASNWVSEIKFRFSTLLTPLKIF